MISHRILGVGGSGGAHWNLHERYISPKLPSDTHCNSHAPAPDQEPIWGVGADHGPLWGRRLEPLPRGGERDPLATALSLPALLRCSLHRSSGQSTADAASQGVGPSSKKHVHHHLHAGPTGHTSKRASRILPPPPDKYQSPSSLVLKYYLCSTGPTGNQDSKKSEDHRALLSATEARRRAASAGGNLLAPPASQPGQHLTPGLRFG